MHNNPTHICFVSHSARCSPKLKGHSCCFHPVDFLPLGWRRGINHCESSTVVGEGHLEPIDAQHLNFRALYQPSPFLSKNREAREVGTTTGSARPRWRTRVQYFSTINVAEALACLPPLEVLQVVYVENVGGDRSDGRIRILPLENPGTIPEFMVPFPNTLSIKTAGFYWNWSLRLTFGKAEQNEDSNNRTCLCWQVVGRQEKGQNLWGAWLQWVSGSELESVKVPLTRSKLASSAILLILFSDLAWISFECYRRWSQRERALAGKRSEAHYIPMVLSHQWPSQPIFDWSWEVRIGRKKNVGEGSREVNLAQSNYGYNNFSRQRKLATEALCFRRLG